MHPHVDVEDNIQKEENAENVEDNIQKDENAEKNNLILTDDIFCSKSNKIYRTLIYHILIRRRCV